MPNDFDSDAMLAFVAELKKQFQDLNKVLQDIGNQSGTGMKKAGDEVERFGQAVKKHAGTSIKEMNTGLKDMATTLLGPVGLVYGMVQIGKAFETFAIGQMRLQNFARDAGYTATSIQKLQGAGEHMGYTIEETNRIISDFGSSVNNLHLDRQASDLWRQLDRIRDGGHEVALTIERMKTEGKDNAEIQQYAADLIVKQLRRQTDEGNRAAQALSEAFKIPISFAEQLAGAKAKVKDDDILVLTPDQRKKQEQYNDEWITMKRRFWKDLGELEQAGINSLVIANENYEKAGTASDYFKKLFGVGEDKQDIRVRGGTEEYQTDLRDPKTGLPLGAAREGLETQKESKGLLQSIRDILQTAFGTTTGTSGTGGGDGGSGGTSGGGMTFRPGVRGGYGTANNSAGVMDQSGKPVDPETVGELTKLAASGNTGGMRALMAQKGYRVDSAWCGDLARTLVGGSGLPVPKGYPVASTWRGWGEHIDPAGINAEGRPFGSIIASKTNVPIGSTGGHVMTIVPGTYDAKNNTAEVIDTGGRRRRSLNGFEERYVGDEAVAKRAQLGQQSNASGAVRGSTFNDRVTASGAPPSQPGIALPTRATLGQWFKVTTPDGRTFDAQQTDVGPAKWTGRGIDINAPLARKMGYDTAHFPTDQIFKYESARGPLDKALRGMGGDLGGAHITVDFNNAPKDTKTSADLMDSGVFKSLKLNRSTAQAGMAGQNTAAANNWSVGE